MRPCLLFVLTLLSLPAFADTLQELYQTAGWPKQRSHFSDALQAAQQRYQTSLPPALYETLLNNSNRRFAAEGMEQRAEAALRSNLDDPKPALTFFQSATGRKVIAAELQATRKDQLAKHSQGLPRIEADATRRLQIRHLVQALPASQAGAEVSLALAGVAADSLSQMLPGLLGADQAQGMLDAQRQRLQAQIDGDLDNTLLYVYRQLSDAELEEFVSFAQSPAGRDYYRAALAAVKAALQGPVQSAGL